MHIKKRDGRTEAVKFDKVSSRLRKQTYNLSKLVDPAKVAQKVINGIYDGISTVDIDALAAETAASLAVEHPDYGMLAARVAISSFHKQNKRPFSDVVRDLYSYVNPKTGKPAPLINQETYDAVMANADAFNAAIVFDRDFNHDYFGWKTLERSYLLRINGRPVECPQHMFMRVAVGIWGNNVEEAIKTYDIMSTGLGTHATPTLFQSGTPMPQMSSCFLMTMQDDLGSIYKVIADSAKISKSAGGIGIDISDIRSDRAYISGTNGYSNGIVPMLQVLNATARYVDQCFAGNTPIMTSRGPRPAEDIRVGDELLTEDGKFDTVKQTMRYPAAGKNLWRIATEHGVSAVIVTDEHPMLAIQADSTNNTEIIAGLDLGIVCSDWTDVRDLRIGDMIAYPVASDGEMLNGVSTLRHNGKMYSRVTAISEIPADDAGRPEWVYDFEMDNIHSYVTPIGTAHNGGGKRKGSIAVYTQVWHSQIFDFLDIRKNSGKEELRARDLFPALWIDDLFMKRVEEDGEWALFSPDEAPGLSTAYGAAFDELYNQYVAEGRQRKMVRARDVWAAISDALIETGTPYLLSKDAANRKSNQQNLGFIRNSNLCAEVIEYTDDTEHAVCNLFSAALPRFVRNGKFDHDDLYRVVRQAVKNLNMVIDRNFYPAPETRKSNMRHRPIGVGVQGLADTYALLGLAFESAEAAKLNREIFETIYFAAVSESVDQARQYGPYETYAGSPASRGQLQFHLWGLQASDLSGMWDWSTVLAEMAQHGLRNSLLTAMMPTASTSQILGNSEAFEPFTSNIFLRKTLSGEFPVVNKHLVRDLEALGLWSTAVRNEIIARDGSVVGIAAIPAEIQERYKTVWEIRKRAMIDQSADRGAFVCQSQSMNLYFDSISAAPITSAIFHGWRRGLKTLSYYVRTKISSSANKNLGIDMGATTAAVPVQTKEEISADLACSLDNPDACIACGS